MMETGKKISRTGSLFALVLALSVPVARAEAQSGEGEGGAPPDSTTLHEEAKHEQARFESYREARIPPSYNMEVHQCDELVGRLCFRHEDGYTPMPEEPFEVTMARTELIRTLNGIGSSIPGDNWVLGQRVFYMGEGGRWSQAEVLANRCNGADPWWCKALVGLTFHARGAFVEAERVFEEAMAEMPADRLEWWRTPGYLLDGDGRELYEASSAEEWVALHERLWLFADPLYLVEGNDRKTADYARRTLAIIKSEAANPFGMEWEEDLTQLTLRYGPEVAWERQRPPPRMGLKATDDRYIVGRHEPGGIDYVPPGQVLERPSEAPEGLWQIEAAKPRSAHRAPYAPDMAAFEAQTARFRRGDSLLVVAAFQPASAAPSRATVREASQPSPQQPFGGPDPFGPGSAVARVAAGDPTSGDVKSGLFLVSAVDGTIHDTRGESAFGVLTHMAPPGQYLLSIEGHNEAAGFGWRNRHGVGQNALPLGLAAVSDVLLLEPEGELPNTLDEAVPHAKKGVRVGPGEPIRLAWEVYGLGLGEVATVAIGFDQGAPSILRIAGQFLGLLQPDGEPVLMSWEDAGPDALGTVFRSVDLQLPDLERGEYTIYVEVQLQGREAMVSNRRLYIEG
jgi:hypothetical protein